MSVREARGYDDAVHIASPSDDGLSLCGQTTSRNLSPFTDPPPDPWSGCWTCLDKYAALLREAVPTHSERGIA